MASLITLPNEIGDLIFEHLTTPDFIHLSETCKQLHVRTLPLAYKHLTLTWYNESEQTGKSPNMNELSSKFRANPELKNSVRRLTLETCNCLTRTQEGELLVDIAGSERANFYGAVGDVIRDCSQLERLNLSIVLVVEDSRWFENLMHGIREPWTKNLKHVHLTRDDTTRDDWVPNQTIVQQEFLKRLALLHAEVIKLDVFDLMDMEEYLKDEELAQRSFWPWAQMKVSKRLHTLRILCCPNPTVAFELILSEASSLRVFDVEFCQHPSCSIDLKTLKTGLDHVKGTLTHLGIRYGALDGAPALHLAELFDSSCGSLGSFRNYDVLTYLEVSLQILFGSQDSSKGMFYPLSAVLPPNLETLVITDDLQESHLYDVYFEHDDAIAIFERFLDGEWREATPQLKELTHDLRKSGPYTFDYWDKKEKSEELMALCEGQGIAGKVLQKS
jgi:hypothetical protein